MGGMMMPPPGKPPAGLPGVSDAGPNDMMNMVGQMLTQGIALTQQPGPQAQAKLTAMLEQVLQLLKGAGGPPPPPGPPGPPPGGGGLPPR